MATGRSFCAYVPQETWNALVARERVEDVLWRALGNSTRPVAGRSSGFPASGQTKFEITFNDPDLGNGEIVSDLHWRRVSPELVRLSYLVDRGLIDSPPGDSGGFWRKVAAPLARAFTALIAFEDDGVSATEAILTRISLREIPFASPGYFLSSDYVKHLGLEKIQDAYASSLRDYLDYLREQGIPPKASASELAKIGAIKYRPFLEHYPDGAILAYLPQDIPELEPENYWSPPGLQR